LEEVDEVDVQRLFGLADLPVCDRSIALQRRLLLAHNAPPARWGAIGGPATRYRRNLL